MVNLSSHLGSWDHFKLTIKIDDTDLVQCNGIKEIIDDVDEHSSNEILTNSHKYPGNLGLLQEGRVIDDTIADKVINETIRVHRSNQ